VATAKKHRAATVKAARYPGGRVRVAPYVVPNRNARGYRDALMVPTRWVKFVIALFLLPICGILTQTFFTAFARATVVQRLWAAAEFWFFSLGVVLWLIVFFGLSRPIILYVFGHELTHAIWVWLMGGRVSRFSVTRDGGHIVTNRSNFWIALAPYFFPLYSILVITLYGGLSLFMDVRPYGKLLYALIGVTWAFHFTFTCWMIPKNQTDLSDHGTFFSLVIIYLMNLTLLIVLLVVAARQVTFLALANDFIVNTSNFAEWVVYACQRFARGAQG
jgi:hypothetical protein